MTQSENCADVLAAGNTQSDIYAISLLPSTASRIDVYCDMDTDGGGWLVILVIMNEI